MSIRDPSNLDGDTNATVTRTNEQIQNSINDLRNTLSPKLVQETEDDRREFDPIAVTRLGGTLPWETDSMSLQCGETVQDTDGDMNMRLNYVCIATQSQFKKLQAMRSSPQGIKLISRAYNKPVNFDELKWDRIPDANGAIIKGEGETNEPLYEIQLQSKEENENTNFGSG